MTSADLWRELEVARQAARAAGRIATDRYERLERIVHKSEKDVVTEVDDLAERIIIETIHEAFPDDGFLAEESGATGPIAERLWVIDPLDGTVNYANGIPFFAVSIGLAVEGQAVLGVVLDPVRDELFSAVHGEGAWLDGAPIRMPPKERLIDAVVHLGLPQAGFERQTYAFRRAVRITRAMGSAALALAYVANGRFDAYVQYRGLSVWDVCAAGVIAGEGGAIISSQLGNAWFDVGMPSRSIGIVAAAPAHHHAYLELLAQPR